MSFSSRLEPRSWPGDRRGQTEPIAALVAVLAIAVGLALYAGVAADQQPRTEEPDAEATMERVNAELLDDGVFSYRENLTPSRFARPGESVAFEIVRESGFVLHIGNRAPPDADVASRPITVVEGTGRYPSRLTVFVWES